MLLDSTVDVVMGTHRVGMSQYLLDHLDGCMRGVRSADGPMHQGHMGMSQYHLCTTAILVFIRHQGFWPVPVWTRRYRAHRQQRLRHKQRLGCKQDPIDPKTTKDHQFLVILVLPFLQESPEIRAVWRILSGTNGWDWSSPMEKRDHNAPFCRSHHPELFQIIFSRGSVIQPSGESPGHWYQETGTSSRWLRIRQDSRYVSTFRIRYVFLLSGKVFEPWKNMFVHGKCNQNMDITGKSRWSANSKTQKHMCPFWN